MVVCVLLLEISAFLRETYQELKKKNILYKPRHNRMQIGSLFSNESSSVSLNNDTGADQTETSENPIENDQSKHISFKDGESMSSTSHINIQMDSTEHLDSHAKMSHNRILQHPRSSLKLGKRMSVKYRNDRSSNKRKLSQQQHHQSQYDNDQEMLHQGIDDESYTATTNSQFNENINEAIELEEIDTTKCFPWIKVTTCKSHYVKFFSSFSVSKNYFRQ
jgi:hypothetical protein